MNRTVKMLLFCTIAGLSGCASAPPYGQHGDVVVGKMAIFRHSTKMAKLECTECHDKLFLTGKQHEKREMEQLVEGKSCGTCHNGRKAFSVTAHCKNCHRKDASS